MGSPTVEPLRISLVVACDVDINGVSGERRLYIERLLQGKAEVDFGNFANYPLNRPLTVAEGDKTVEFKLFREMRVAGTLDSWSAFEISMIRGVKPDSRPWPLSARVPSEDR